MNARSIVVFAVAAGVLVAAVRWRGAIVAGRGGSEVSEENGLVGYFDSWAPAWGQGQAVEAAQVEAVESGGAADSLYRDAVGALSSVYEYIEEGFQFVGLVDSSAKYRDAISDPANFEYVDRLIAAESRQGIPAGLLLRLAYQESRFRPDIVEGRKLSSAGAVGIMQIVPKWHPSVDPYDWRASVDYAAVYLRQLFEQFKTWELALKAYNTGPANLKKILAGKMREPLETQKYSREILADAGIVPRRVVA